LTSDFKDKFKRFICNSLYKLSPLLELKIVRGKPTPKRLKYKRSESVILLAFGISLPSSTKTFKDESRKCKRHLYYKFTKRYLSKYIDNKSR
jgi:hypothetical protein